ncbi:MAG: ABC transporter ATP-binding protein [Bacillota bacterium]|nr:ABC transporter ATP-binding protein [Bacillota bacterium]
MKDLLNKRKKAFAVYVAACLIPVITQMMNNYVFARLLGSVESQNMRDFYIAIYIAASFVILSTLLYILSRFLRIRFMRDTILDIRLQAFDKILRYNLERFGKKSKDVYVSNLINDINLFEQNFFFKLINIIFRGGVYVVSLVVLLILDPRFALAIFAVSVVIFLISKRFEKKTIELQDDVSGRNEAFTVNVANTFNGLEILKLNNIEETFLDKTLKMIDRVESKKMHYGIFAEGQRSITRLLGTGIFVVILIYMLEQLNQGLSITRMTFMIQLANGCVWPLEQVMPMINELKASVKIYDKIAGNDVGENTAVEGQLPFVFNDCIEIKNLSFQFEDRKVLSDINLKIEKGKKYLLKGSSGSGKSTLIKLLSKVYDDYEGTIEIDGVNLKDIKISEFNDKVSFIFQDVFLFEDTLYNNIALFKPDYEEHVKEAVKKSGLSDLAERNLNFINMDLSENGKNLSGGQRQRISIARAIAKDVDVLFADEATSSLDAELGRKIEETLLTMECTLIAVSHRTYEEVSEMYDFVLELKNGHLTTYSGFEYFEEVVA